MAGKVYLVGAGPGDPELLTLKAHKLLQEADCVLYDSLINPAILDLAENAEKVHVGKRLGKASLHQDQINRRLVEAAKTNQKVVRLKGGDPFIFGRGGEELSYLHAHKIEIELVPGVTAASATAARLQIPLTHREHGQSVIFLSGYSKDRTLPEYDWQFLAKQSLTLVFYMGLHHVNLICKKLIDSGIRPQTPVAVVSNSTLSNEKVLYSNVFNIERDLSQKPMPFPALIIIGNVIDTKKSYSNKNTEPDSAAGVLVVFHGARMLQTSPIPTDFITKLKSRVNYAHMEFGFLTKEFNPNYFNAAEKLSQIDTIKRVYVWPLFLLPGKHLLEDVPNIPAQLKEKHPNIDFQLWPAPDIIDDLLDPLAIILRKLN